MYTAGVCTGGSGKTIDTVLQRNNLTTFRAALNATGLMDPLLTDPGFNGTVFAPTNQVGLSDAWCTHSPARLHVVMPLRDA